MITRKEVAEARRRAGEMIRAAGLVVTDREVENMEVADFGLSNLAREGAQILTMFNTDRISGRVIALFPGQTEPEHWHIGMGSDPGKEETIRVVQGTVFFNLPGEETAARQGSIPEGKEACYTVRHEIVMRPGDQITIPPGTKHWFQAGVEGAVIYSFSTCARDATDQFTDPDIVRITKIID